MVSLRACSEEAQPKRYNIMAKITMQDMLSAGVHFGHQTRRWNPKMKPYVYGARDGIHIIDLQKSVAKAQEAGDFVKNVAATGGRMIFVGTKKQAVEPIKTAAEKSEQYYITKRWLGGTLTNFQTIKLAIDKLKKIDRLNETGEINRFSKKERAGILKQYEKSDGHLHGILDIRDNPQVMFVVDLNKEHIAVAEANRLGIPVVGIADTNSNPENADWPIPGNDDAIRSITLITNFIADSFIEGAQLWQEELQNRVNQEGETQMSDPGETEITEKPASSTGPAVVKVSRGRKMVAAGTGELAEIEMELEKEQTTPKTEGEEGVSAAATDEAMTENTSAEKAEKTEPNENKE